MAAHEQPAGKAHGRAAGGCTIDTGAKFVRVTEVREDGFVAFDFAIGEPEIYVEMLLPRDAFEAFCAEHNPVRLDATAPVAATRDDFLWRLADAARAAAPEGAAPSQPTD